MGNTSGLCFVQVLKPTMFLNPQSAPVSLPTTTLLTSSAFPQALPVPHYSQPAIPLGHFANLLSYPIQPQSYPYLPLIQQTLYVVSPFHPSAVLHNAGMKYSQLQYESNLPTPSLPQASAISHYGGFGSSSSIPGGLNLTHTTASNTMIGINEALSQQYREASHFLSLQQQNEDPSMWIYGAGSRTTPPLPPSTLRDYQGQNQQSSFRQVLSAITAPQFRVLKHVPLPRRLAKRTFTESYRTESQWFSDHHTIATSKPNLATRLLSRLLIGDEVGGVKTEHGEHFLISFTFSPAKASISTKMLCAWTRFRLPR
ncbi:hypothetical protein ZIOFF_029282 [Zingiber officinale]|uniref:Uncharacterized protein n=1 Tax=Zingiber officinale TaxID=94328 RepID=A0A8J5L431_ZINOF|nr:hypothetical protein ZIOFF_029282 [Zingiber officinale]